MTLLPALFFLLSLPTPVLGQSDPALGVPPGEESRNPEQPTSPPADANDEAEQESAGEASSDPEDAVETATDPAEGGDSSRDIEDAVETATEPGAGEDSPSRGPTPAPKEDSSTASEKDEEEEREPGPSKFKPGTGFVFETPDERFNMGVRVRVQFSNVTDFVKEQDENGDLQSEVENTFGIRRARLQFKGHMWGKNNKYKLEIALSPRDLGLRLGGNPTRTPLLSFYTEHTQLRDLSVRVGQYKLLYSRQRVISSGNQEFVDRSEAQGEFNLDRDVGIHLFSQDLGGLEIFKYYAGISIAEGRDAWETEGLGKDDAFSYQLLGRVEVLPFGHFKDYSEGDFERGEEPGLSIGMAYAYTKNGARERGYLGDVWADGGTVDYQNLTADVLFKQQGLSLFGEFFFRDGGRNRGDITTDAQGNPLDPMALESRDGVGYTLQAGYVLSGAPVNFGARYSAITRAGYSDSSSALTDSSEAGATMGFFPGGHPFKIQADYFHLWGDDYAGGSADRVRVQMQVAY